MTADDARLKSGDNALLLKRMTQRRAYVVTLLFFLIGALGYLLPVTAGFHSVPGDLADARFNSVILEHIYQWTTGNVDSLWSPPFFFPFSDVLAFSENNFGSAPLYVIFRALHLSREHAFAAWFVAGYVLNFAACVYVLRQLGFPAFAAAAGAFAFTFSLPVLAQEGHAQLTHRFAIPLAFLNLWSVLLGKHDARLSRVFFWLTVQFLCSIYLGVFLAEFLLVILLFAWLSEPQAIHALVKSRMSTRLGPANLLSVVLGLVSLLTLGLLLEQYQSVATYYAFSRPYDEVATMLPRLSSFLIADRSGLSSFLASEVRDIPMRHEHQMFFGFGVWLLALAALNRQPSHAGMSRLRAGWLWSLLVFVALTVSIQGYSLYMVLLHMPGLGAIRAVTRIVLLLAFPMAGLVAIGVERLRLAVEPKGTAARGLAMVTVALALGAETVTYLPNTTSVDNWRARIAALDQIAGHAVKPGGIVYVSRREGEAVSQVELDGMIFAQDRHLKTVNGYSGNVPPGYAPPDPCISPISRVYGYYDFKRLPHESAAGLANDMITLAPEPCRNRPTVAGTFRIDRTTAEALALSFNIQRSGSRLVVHWELMNGSTQTIETLSTVGPISFSWRFVPLDGKQQGSRQPEWNTRKELLVSMHPGEMARDTFLVDTPKVPGYYRLELSMVQELIAWFHDLGMSVPHQDLDTSQDIPVGMP